jgi:hypothetical protein
MMRAILILVSVLIASVLTAAEPQQITVWRITEPGDYVIVGIQIVHYTPSVPVVPPVDPPVVLPTTDLAKAVVAEISKLPATDKRHTAAMKLTATYQMLAGQVKDGKIHPTNAVAAADMICPIALGTDGKAWASVFSVVNAAVGKAGTAEATAAVFDEAATTTLSTVPASGDLEATAERYGFDWTSFLAFLMKLLEILLPLIIS